MSFANMCRVGGHVVPEEPQEGRGRRLLRSPYNAALLGHTQRDGVSHQDINTAFDVGNWFAVGNAARALFADSSVVSA